MRLAVAVARGNKKRPASIIKVPCFAENFIGFTNSSGLVRLLYLVNELVEQLRFDA